MMTETSVLSSRLKVEVQRNCLSSVGSLFYARGAATEKAVTNPIRVVRGTTRSPLTLIPATGGGGEYDCINGLSAYFHDICSSLFLFVAGFALLT